MPRHTPHPLSRGLWLILGQRVSQRHLTEREGQRKRERRETDLVERNDSLLVYNKKCFNYSVQFTTTTEGCGSKSQGNQEGNSLCAYLMEIFFMSSRFATVFALFYYPLCAVCPVIYLCTYTYVFIYTYMCVCVCISYKNFT